MAVFDKVKDYFQVLKRSSSVYGPKFFGVMKKVLKTVLYIVGAMLCLVPPVLAIATLLVCAGKAPAFMDVCAGATEKTKAFCPAALTLNSWLSLLKPTAEGIMNKVGIKDAKVLDYPLRAQFLTLLEYVATQGKTRAWVGPCIVVLFAVPIFVLVYLLMTSLASKKATTKVGKVPEPPQAPKPATMDASKVVKGAETPKAKAKASGRGTSPAPQKKSKTQ